MITEYCFEMVYLTAYNLEYLSLRRVSAKLYFKEILSIENWNELYKLVDLNEAFDNFYQIISFHFNINVLKKKRYTPDTNKTKQWVSNDVRASNRGLRDLHTLRVSFPDLASVYKEFKTSHASLVRNTRKRYFQDKIFKSDNHAKAAWSGVFELTDNDKRRQIRNMSLFRDSSTYEDPDEVSSMFGHYFSDVACDTINKISKSNLPSQKINIPF